MVFKEVGIEKNESIDHPWINKAIERAQKKSGRAKFLILEKH